MKYVLVDKGDNIIDKVESDLMPLIKRLPKPKF